MKKCKKTKSKKENQINDELQEENLDEEEGHTSFLALGMCLGVSFGMAIGLAMGNAVLGMCIGMCFGMLLGGGIDAKNGHKVEDAEGEAEETQVEETKTPKDGE